jgi:hypothetical protein
MSPFRHSANDAHDILYRDSEGVRSAVGRTRAPNGSACETCRKKKIKVRITRRDPAELTPC